MPDFRISILALVLAIPFGAAAREALDDVVPGVPIEAENELTVLTRDEFEDVAPLGQLSGRDIYERYLDNRIHSAIQYQRVISTDPGGSTQTTRFWIRWKDFRDSEGQPVDGVINKTLIKFREPFDLRNTGYLIVVNDDYSRDQWVYQPSARKLRRVNVTDANVGGSDLSFSDFGFSNIEDADYERLADEEIGGIPVYVVEANAKPQVISRYRRTLAYLDQEHYVPLKTRYWDRANVEIRQMNAEPDSLKEFNGIWVATNSLMTNLQQNTSSQVFVEDLDPNVEIADHLFSTFQLTLFR